MRVDTLRVRVIDDVFLSEEALADRRTDLAGNVIPFVVDSIGYVPFGKDDAGNVCMFTMETAMVSAGRQQSPVFHLIDPCPYDPKMQLQMGSLEQVSTSGNWGE